VFNWVKGGVMSSSCAIFIISYKNIRLSEELIQKKILTEQKAA
jgi:hypothetical protein